MIACPGCGYEAADDFAFCPKCASALAAPRALPEERKVVTTLFCDLVSFTAHSEAADHELIDALLQRYSSIAKQLVEDHGGAVEKFIGDAVVAVFGFPHAHDDDAERAVLTAFRLMEEASGLSWPDGEPIRLRIGINSGESYVHTDIGPASGRSFLTGDAVNTAARLETAAPPNGIVVGHLTHELTRHAVAFAELEPLTVKGKREPVRAWLAQELLERRSRTGLRTTGKLDTPFLGRARERRKLTTAFQKAVSTGHTEFVLVVGEPGIGKSRLVLELSRELDELPGLITWRQGRCSPYGDGSGLAALSEIVKLHAAILDSDDIATVEAKLEAVLPDGDERPWLRQHLRPLLGLDAPQASRGEVLAAWTQFLRHVASDGPTVIVFEDLHWAGESLLAFVDHLSAHRLDRPLLVVATARPELFEGHSTTQLRSPSLSRVTLAPLSKEHAGRLVAALLDERLAEDLLDPILERVGGNPLYAEEYVRLLLERGHVVRTNGRLQLRPDQDLALPETVQAVISARIDTLSQGRKALLCDAAVFGETFWADAVAALGDRDQDAVRSGLDDLVTRQLVRPVTGSKLEGEREYVFWHALTRDVAYEQLPLSVRARKHGRAAAWFETKAGDGQADVVELLAHHYSAGVEFAGSAGLPALRETLIAPAVRYLPLAGDRVLPADASAARRYYERAIALVPPDDPLRPTLLSQLGEILHDNGHMAQSVEVLDEAIAAFEAVNDVPALALAKMRLINALIRSSDPRLDEERAAFPVLLASLEARGPSPELMKILCDWGRDVYLTSADPVAAIEACDKTLEIAALLKLPVSVRALRLRAVARADLGDEAALQDISRALDECAEQGLDLEHAFVLGNQAIMLGWLSGPREAVRVLRQARDLAGRRGRDAAALIYSDQLVESLLLMGAWDESLMEAEALETAAERAGTVSEMWGMRSSALLIRVWRGQVQSSADWLPAIMEWGRSEESYAASTYAAVPVAAAYRELGSLEAARDVLADWNASPKPTQFNDCAGFLPEGARTALACRDPDLVSQLVEGERPVVPISASAWCSTKALVAEARGDHAGALVYFDEAARRWSDFGVPYEEGHALLGRGRCLAALGMPREAAPTLQKAQEVFARLGAKPALRETETVLASVAPHQDAQTAHRLPT